MNTDPLHILNLKDLNTFNIPDTTSRNNVYTKANVLKVYRILRV